MSAALAALREATAAQHAALDAKLPIARGDATHADYARHVAVLHSWLAPIEARLWAGAWPAELEPAARAVKADWLATDLAVARAAGFAPPSGVGPAADVPADIAARCGWNYVIEGSLLGGRVLLRRLEARLAPWPLRWLHGYGEAGPRRWRDFLGALDRTLRAPQDIEHAARGAVEAFRTLDARFDAMPRG